MILKYTVVIFLVFLFNIINQSHSQYQEVACEIDGIPGICSHLRRCRTALNEMMMGKAPQNCSSMGKTQKVCCVPISSIPATSTCPPIPASAVKIKKSGNIAADKCIDWEELIYPCVKSGVLLPDASQIRADQCSHNVVPLIIGGTASGKNEFPHMVLLGFEFPPPINIHWGCGGTLISERWVMTAGHCTWLPKIETLVKYARLGSKDIGAVTNPQLMHTIKTIVTHPNYKRTSIYNDIALLELDRDVKFSKSVIPGCLHTDTSNNNIEKFLASGWGIFANNTRSTKLLKVTLQKFNHSECYIKKSAKNPSPVVVRDETQICAGHHTEAKDTCQGDSGGPLQIYNLDVYCTYTVVGVISTGRDCGTPGQPALYTRVSAFIPWIESVVWP